MENGLLYDISDLNWKKQKNHGEIFLVLVYTILLGKGWSREEAFQAAVQPDCTGGAGSAAADCFAGHHAGTI